MFASKISEGCEGVGLRTRRAWETAMEIHDAYKGDHSIIQWSSTMRDQRLPQPLLFWTTKELYDESGPCILHRPTF